MKLRITSIALSLVILLGIVGTLIHATDPGKGSVDWLLVSSAFCGFPLIVSILLSILCRHPASQIILAAASLLYGGWFAYAVHNAFYVNLDPQSGLVFLFVGIYALPVLLWMWLAAGFVGIYKSFAKTRTV